MVHLLRAIRNKRNHIWTLSTEVRQLLGEADEAMASYWNSRFPSLLPLLVILSRSQGLAEVPQFRRFWPTVKPTPKLSKYMTVHLMEACCRPVATPIWQRLCVS